MSRFTLPCLFFLLPLAGRASDGFDNNYVGYNANQLLVTLDGVPHAVLFGPGAKSAAGGYYLPVENGQPLDIGAIQALDVQQIVSYLRSAYLDRVVSTTFYYRVYPAGMPPPAWSTVALQPIGLLPGATCFGTTQNNTWETAVQYDLLQGLPEDDYVFEFYLQSELYDVGEEAPDPCAINADLQCDPSIVHPDRFLSTRFPVTDPSACNLPAILAGLAAPTRLTFELSALAAADEEPGGPAFRLYPNPAREAVFIDVPGHSAETLTWSVLDALGRPLLRGELDGSSPARLPVGQLPAGNYRLVLVDERGRAGVKMLAIH